MFGARLFYEAGPSFLDVLEREGVGDIVDEDASIGSAVKSSA